ncbi:prion-inhibition and propagation-domain-containing protein [Rhexocercosporidium sp. MPI-PUGE-AT-0058]|nr:prion-inhibition and propagation-domain-containing protein [Rhexocercosporidium sp. MPI-PUGE-AT-0058]
MAEMALAAVSLSFQVFSGCIQGYQLLSEAAALPKEYQYVRIRVRMEQFRLLDWASVAGLSENDSSLVVGRAGKAMFMDVLEQQHELLYRFGRFDHRLKPLSKPLLMELHSVTSCEPEDGTNDAASLVELPRFEGLFNKVRSYLEATRTVPTRLRWAVCDKAAIDAMLSKISTLNDFLTELLSKDHADRLHEVNTRTYYGMMQLNSSFGQLLNIIKAGHVTTVEEYGESKTAGSIEEKERYTALLPASWQQGSNHDHFGASQTKSQDSFLTSLAQLKALKAAIHQGCLTPIAAHDMGFGDSAQGLLAQAELSKEDFLFLDEPPSSVVPFDGERTDAIFYQRKARDKGINVWIEWKFQHSARPMPTRRLSKSPSQHDNAAVKTSKMRTERLTALVTLLRNDKNTRLFRASSCLGYLSEKIHIPESRRGVDTHRYGLVFLKPPECDSSSKLVSLLELLTPINATSHLPITIRRISPSLTERLVLAQALVESVERLHAIDWLHKGLRSHNILFPTTADGLECGDKIDVDLSRPIISGFEYARPVFEPLWSENSFQNPAHDLYRHPEVQADAGRDLDEHESAGMFKKNYDIFSLGVMLLEIAVWKPVHTILGIDLGHAMLKDTISVQRRLLNEEKIMQEVKFSMGDAISQAITACLTGMDFVQSNVRGESLDGESGLRLQREFYTKVVLAVKGMSI